MTALDHPKVSIRLDPRLRKALFDRAHEERRSATDVLTRALRSALTVEAPMERVVFQAGKSIEDAAAEAVAQAPCVFTFGAQGTQVYVVPGDTAADVVARYRRLVNEGDRG